MAILVSLLVAVAPAQRRGGHGGGGHGGSSGAVTTPPTAPTNLRVTARSQTSISLAWNAATDNSGKLTYILQTNDSQFAWIDQATPFTTSTGLLPGQSYKFVVFAIDASGNRSAMSNTVVATTVADTVPPSSPTLSVTSVGSARLTLDWTPSTDDVTGVTYEVLVNGVPTTLGDNLFWTGDGTSAYVLRLAPGTSYSLAVRAKDTSGNASPSSNVVNVTTSASSDSVGPSMPAGLFVYEDVGCGLIGIKWTQSTDDVTPQSGIRYEVYVNGFYLEGAAVTGTNIADVWGLTGQGDTITVIAFDAAGNASPPATIHYG